MVHILALNIPLVAIDGQLAVSVANFKVTPSEARDNASKTIEEQSPDLIADLCRSVSRLSLSDKHALTPRKLLKEPAADLPVLALVLWQHCLLFLL